MAALTLQQAQSEWDRIVVQIEDRQERLAVLNEYIAVLKQQVYLDAKKADALSKGDLDGVRY